MKYLNLIKASAALLAIVLVSGCSKSGSNPQPQDNAPKLAITSIDLNAGPYTTRVVIKGTGFSATATDDQVYFNGVAANVSSATSTMLAVQVPLAAGTGNISVKVNGTTSVGPIFTYQPAEVISPFVGGDSQGNTDGKGVAAKFSEPYGLAADAAGNVYVADENNNAIRKITPDGTVSTFAGSGVAGHADGQGTAASFSSPEGAAVDNAGNVYVADKGNGLVRKIAPSGLVSTIIDASTGQAANFGNPSSLAIDGSGNIFVVDKAGSLIRKYSTNTGALTNFYTSISLDAYGLAIDKNGNLYTANAMGNVITEISASGVASVFAGDGNIAGGALDGVGTGASFHAPYNLAIDKDGNLFVIDKFNMLIRKITPSAEVVTFAGHNPINEFGPINTASMAGIQGIVIDNNGNIYVSVQSAIRKIANE